MGVIALGLYSGGLDSILACRVIAAQGIRVIALKFVTPFFDHDLLSRQEAFRAEVRAQFAIDVELVDLSASYLTMLRKPAHGFGKHFNPCIDCKILMLSTARQMLSARSASFLITGEVLGQRPMSQRRDTLRLIERESGCQDILLRPLCAKHLPPSLPEREGIVDRNRLLDFAGRGRKQQIELAARFGITGYPAPAGGCMLTDPNLASRIAGFHEDRMALGVDLLEIDDFNLMHVGRQFRLRDGHWLIVGRSDKENGRLEALAHPGDVQFRLTDRPGPLALLRRADLTLDGGSSGQEALAQAAALVVRYAKKIDGAPAAGKVEIRGSGECRSMTVEPVADAELSALRI